MSYQIKLDRVIILTLQLKIISLTSIKYNRDIKYINKKVLHINNTF